MRGWSWGSVTGSGSCSPHILVGCLFSLPQNIELQPLVEEGRDEEGERDPLRTPTIVVEAERDPLRTPTIVVEAERDPLRTPTIVVEAERDPLRTPTIVVEAERDPLRTPTIVVEAERDPLRTPTIVVEGEQLDHHEVPTHDTPREEVEPVHGNLRVEPEQTTLGVRPAQAVEMEPAAAVPKTDSVGQPHNPQFYDRELDVSQHPIRLCTWCGLAGQPSCACIYCK